jgi:AcrR family transcriptional regulator
MLMRARILESCQELFFKHGVRTITMDDIAAHLGISKKTIYQYFDTKEEIVVEVARQYVEREKQEFETIRAATADPLDESIQLMLYTSRTLGTASPTLPDEVSKYFPEAWKLLYDFNRNYYIGVTRENILRGQAAGLYRPDIDAEILARIHVELHPFLFTSSFFPPEQFPPERVHLQYAMHFLYGICTPQGLQLLEEYKKTKLNLISTSHQ